MYHSFKSKATVEKARLYQFIFKHLDISYILCNYCINIDIFGKLACKYIKLSINIYKVYVIMRKLFANIFFCWNSRFQHFGLSVRLIMKQEQSLFSRPETRLDSPVETGARFGDECICIPCPGRTLRWTLLQRKQRTQTPLAIPQSRHFNLKPRGVSVVSWNLEICKYRF